VCLIVCDYETKKNYADEGPHWAVEPTKKKNNKKKVSYDITCSLYQFMWNRRAQVTCIRGSTIILTFTQVALNVT
jgi:hypothetical protein